MKLKNLLLITCLFLTKTYELNAQSGVIHLDPYDIKKTSITIGGSYTFPRGTSIHTMVNHYLNTKTMIYYSGNYFIKPFEEPDYRDAIPSLAYNPTNQNSMTMYNEIGLDWHFSDRVKKVNITILLDKYKMGYTVHNTIVKVPSIKRKIWALHGGILAMTGRERFFREGLGKLETYYLLNTATNAKVDVIPFQNNPAHAISIFSNASIFNLEFGLRNKEIFATAYQSQKYGKKFSDVATEWYIVGILPIASSFQENVYLNKTSTRYQIIENVKPKPGFKIGFNARTSLKSKYSYGADFGFLPSIVSGNVMYYGGRLGINLNFGKVKYLEANGTETESENE